MNQTQALPRLYSTMDDIAPEDVHELWRRKRRAQLEREPNCRRCSKAGKTIAASVATHVRRLRGNVEIRTFLHSELQSLCTECSERDPE